MKKRIGLGWMKGIFISYGISAVLMLLLAFLVYQGNISDNVIRGGILFSYVLSCFVGGAVVSRRYSSKRFFWGLMTGITYFLFLWLVSMVGNREVFAGFPGCLSTLFLCVCGGMLGGMFQAGRE